MIAATPLDAVIDYLTASLNGDLVRLVFGSLEGVLVILGLSVLSVSLLTIATGMERGAALARVARFSVAIWLLGATTTTTVTIWMRDSPVESSATGQAWEVSSLGGDTPTLFAALMTLQDAVVFGLLDLIQGSGPGDELAVQDAWVYGLTALQQASRFPIEDPLLSRAFDDFWTVCAPRAFHDLTDGEATFLDWLEGGHGSTRFAYAEGTGLAVVLEPAGEAVVYQDCAALHADLRQAYVEHYAERYPERYADATRAAANPDWGERFLRMVGATESDPTAIAWKRILEERVEATADRYRGPIWNPGSVHHDPTRSALDVLDLGARGTGRGELWATGAITAFGWLDALFDGGFTTKLMAQFWPLVNAVVRGLLYLLFVPAWLALAVGRGDVFAAWFGATLWTKVMYVVMALMLKLELFFGKASSFLDGVPLAEMSADSIDTFAALSSLVFFLGSTVGGVAAASVLIRGGAALGTTVSRSAGGQVQGAVAGATSAAALAGGAVARSAGRSRAGSGPGSGAGARSASVGAVQTGARSSAGTPSRGGSPRGASGPAGSRGSGSSGPGGAGGPVPAGRPGSSPGATSGSAPGGPASGGAASSGPRPGRASTSARATTSTPTSGAVANRRVLAARPPRVRPRPGGNR